MNRLLTIISNGDLYEVRIEGYMIRRIVRYQSDSTMRREMTFDEVPGDVQEKILNEIEEQ